MEIYLVGGAVRDELLGRAVHERDWVVVGASPETLLEQGYQPVGKDFPVFLHPETKEEYALARTERKIRKGYAGFEFHADADVTLEEDLARRDLTINAMAKTFQGELIDPFGGQEDLKHKILRHVSTAFAEDPVRILRAARLAARFPDFSVADNTLLLMQQMVNNGEVDALVAERVWQEWHKALNETAPTRFFEILDDATALNILFPELSISDAGIKALALAPKYTEKPEIRFAALCYHLKPHIIKQLCERLRIPKRFRELAALTAQLFNDYFDIPNADAAGTLHFLKSADAVRRPDRFADLLIALDIACLAHNCDANAAHTQLIHAQQALQNLDCSALRAQNLKGQAYAKALKKLQLDTIQALK